MRDCYSTYQKSKKAKRGEKTDLSKSLGRVKRITRGNSQATLPYKEDP